MLCNPFLNSNIKPPDRPMDGGLCAVCGDKCLSLKDNETICKKQAG